MTLSIYLVYTALLVVIDALHDWARRGDRDEYMKAARLKALGKREEGQRHEDAGDRFNVLWHRFAGARIALAAFALGYAAFGPALSDDGTILAAFAALVLFAGLRWIIHDGILNYTQGQAFGYVGAYALSDVVLRRITFWTRERPRPWRVVAVKVIVLAGAVWAFAAVL